MEKSSTATLECEDIKTRLQNDDEDSIPLADDDVSASVLGTVSLLNLAQIGNGRQKKEKRMQNLSKKYNSRLREDMGGDGRIWEEMGVADEY